MDRTDRTDSERDTAAETRHLIGRSRVRGMQNAEHDVPRTCLMGSWLCYNRTMQCIIKNPIIMFDFDGVVADSLEVYFDEFTKACHELGFHRLNSREAFLRLFEGNVIRQLFWAGFPMYRIRRLLRTFAPRIAEAQRRVSPFAEMPEVVRDLAAVYPVYVITSNATDTILDFLLRHNICGIRDVLGSDKERSKVKKIRSIMRRHPGLTPCYIGDTKGDIREARHAGAVPIAVAWGWHTVAKLLEGKPEVVVDTPQSLRKIFLRE